jgi:hypothetical protein
MNEVGGLGRGIMPLSFPGIDTASTLSQSANGPGAPESPVADVRVSSRERQRSERLSLCVARSGLSVTGAWGTGAGYVSWLPGAVWTSAFSPWCSLAKAIWTQGTRHAPIIPHGGGTRNLVGQAFCVEPTGIPIVHRNTACHRGEIRVRESSVDAMGSASTRATGEEPRGSAAQGCRQRSDTRGCCPARFPGIPTPASG